MVWILLLGQVNILFAVPSKQNADSLQKVRVNSAELRREISELRQTVIKKVNDDANIIAEGFTSSKAIIRRLRLAYTFKATLDSVSNGFGLVAGVADANSLKNVFLKGAKSPTEWASLALAVDNVVENSGKLSFAFNGTSFVAGVDEIIEVAESSQPVIGFDEPRYRSSIEQSLFGFNGQNIVVAPRKKALDPCQTIKPRGEKFERLGTFKNLDEVRRYLTGELQKLEAEIDGKNYTLAQTAQLITLVKQIKTALLESKIHSTSINLSVPTSLAVPNCKANLTKISLGKIAARQTLLSAAYQAFDQKLQIEQAETLKSAADGITGATQIYLAGKGGNQAQKKVLDYISNFSLAADIGLWTVQRTFQSEPEKMIAEVPQMMLLDLPQESANVVLLIDTLKTFFRQNPSTPKPITPKIPETPTMFLLDLSDSMNENDKIGQAKNAGLNAVGEMQENRRRGQDNSSVAIWTFGGECTPNNVKQLMPFTGSLSQAENTFRRGIPRPAGMTPLLTAIDLSVDQMTDYLASRPHLSEARIVVLTDGMNTCPQQIRPRGVYSQSQNIVYRKVKFYCIGFDIPPGSKEERDLQYLASASGGKYFPARNAAELNRVFQKVIRVYLPKISGESNVGTQAILNRDFENALKIWIIHVRNNPKDAIGFYNLAVACEAVENYKCAADNYRQYLSLLTDAPETREVGNRITKLEEDYQVEISYYIDVLRSDLEYLKEYYKRLSSLKNDELAAEFAGFVAEKGAFYRNLPETLEIRSVRIERGTKELADSLDFLNRRVGSPTFDRDAISLLTFPISHLEELIERIEAIKTQNTR